MFLVILLLFILLGYLLIKDSIYEEKLFSEISKLLEVAKKYFIELVQIIKVKIKPSNWEYSTSWLSKGKRVLYLKEIDQYNNVRVSKFYCNDYGYSFKDENGHFVEWSKGTFLESLWQECVTNERYKDNS